jgi:hypothetical protein
MQSSIKNGSVGSHKAVLKLLRNGMQVQMGSDGILNTPRKYGRTGKPLHAFAGNVAIPTKHATRANQSSVTPTVKPKHSAFVANLRKTPISAVRNALL